MYLLIKYDYALITKMESLEELHIGFKIEISADGKASVDGVVCKRRYIMGEDQNAYSKEEAMKDFLKNEVPEMIKEMGYSLYKAEQMGR